MPHKDWFGPVRAIIFVLVAGTNIAASAGSVSAASAVDKAEEDCRSQAQGAYLVNHKFQDLWKVYSECRAQSGISDVSLTLTMPDCENPMVKPFCKPSNPLDFSDGTIPGPRQPSDKLDISDLMKLLKQEGVFLQVKPSDVQKFSIPTENIFPADRLQIQQVDPNPIWTNPADGVVNPGLNDTIRNQLVIPNVDGGVMIRE